MDRTTLIRAVEAILFVSCEPVPLRKFEEVFAPDGVEPRDVREALEALRRDFTGRGVELIEVGGGYQMRTSPELRPILARMEVVRPVKLTQAALETLAIIAYRQPLTRAEAEEVRGVDCGAVVRSLLDRGLIRVVGKKDMPGRPILYGTTRKFLEVFGLASLNDLPTLREIEELTGSEAGEALKPLPQNPAPQLPLGDDDA